MKLKKSINIILLLFLVVTQKSSYVFGQKIKIKKDIIVIDKQPVLTINKLMSKNTDKVNITSLNNSSELEIILEYTNSEVSGFDNFNITISNPSIEITFLKQKLESIKEQQAIKDVVHFLITENILRVNGVLNTDMRHLENFSKENEASFWFKKSSKLYKIGNSKYDVSIIYFFTKNNQKEVYRFTQLDNNGKALYNNDIEKYYNKNGEELTSILEFINCNDTFVIHREKTSKDGHMMYGIEKINFDTNGKLITNNNGFHKNKLYPLSYKANTLIGEFYKKKYYTISTDNGKFRLTNLDHIDVFNRAYDNITINDYFIKTVSGDSITIYRGLDLEKIEVPTIKKIYFSENNIEILTNQGPLYYVDEITKPFGLYKNRIRGVCGNNKTSISYKFKQHKTTKKHSIELHESFGCCSRGRKTTINIKGIQNNVTHFEFLKTPTIYNSKGLVIAEINEKKGIYSCRIDRKKYKHNFRLIDDENNKVKPVTFKEVLPIEYDKIESLYFNGPICIYKDSKINFYPNHMNVNFEYIQKKTDSFYEIRKNGISGWLDVKTFKEYYF